MQGPQGDAEVLGQFADQFVRALRSGGESCIEEFCEFRPDLAPRIRDLCATLELLERFSRPLRSPAVSTPFRIGDYLVQRELGKGGMGVVYEALQESLGRRVALKLLSGLSARGPTALERFQREAKAAASLHHTNIVPVFGIGEDQGLHYYVMQYVEGAGLDLVLGALRRILQGSALPFEADPHAADPLPPGLAGRIAERFVEPAAFQESSAARRQGRPRWEAIARLGQQIAEALAYSHRCGVLHRDVKPSNLLVDEEGAAWLTDFGLAHLADGEELTQSGDLLGTLRYLAPERLRGACDERADVYALGAVLYEMITLRPLFGDADRHRLVHRIEAETPPAPRTLDRSIPRDLETIVVKAMAKDPAHRYPSASALAEDLRRFRGGRPVLARRTSRLEAAWRWGRRNPTVAGLAAALILAMLAGLAGVTWQWRAAEHATTVARSAAAQLESARRLEQAARKEAQAKSAEILRNHQRLLQAFELLERARRDAGLQHWDDAEGAYSAALESYPNLMAAFAERGDLYFKLHLNDLAAADFERQFQLQPPEDAQQWLRRGLLSLERRDWAKYEQVRDDMRQAYTDGRLWQIPRTVIGLVKIAALDPRGAKRPLELVALAEQAIERDGRLAPYLATLGLAHYRAGQFEQAIRACQESLAADRLGAGPSICAPILALAYSACDSAKSADALSQAVALFDQTLDRMLRPDDNTWAVHQGATGAWPLEPLEWLEFRLLLDEALRQPRAAPATDPRVRLLRARAFAALRHPWRANWEYLLLLGGTPAAELRAEAYRSQAFLMVAWGQFHLAAQRYELAAQHAPQDLLLRRFQSVAELACGDEDAHRQTCRAMLEQWTADPAAQNAESALMVTEVCVCLPDTLPNWALLLPLAELGAQHVADSPRYLAAAQYRSGQFEFAKQQLLLLEKLTGLRASDLCFLAMSHARLDQPAEARQRLRQAENWARAADAYANGKGSTFGAHADWGAWTERPQTLVLLREARSLVAPPGDR